MNFFKPILILSFAFLAVFGEATLSAPRSLLGAQIDLLPALMVYAALSADIVTLSLLAVLGGTWFASLSANPLGVTILPLMMVGFPIYLRRDLILRGLPFAQFVLGAAALAARPRMNCAKNWSRKMNSRWRWIAKPMRNSGNIVTPSGLAESASNPMPPHTATSATVVRPPVRLA